MLLLTLTACFAQLLGLTLYLVTLLPILFGIKRNTALVGTSPVFGIEGRCEDRSEAVIVGLADRIVPMIMATSATDGQPQQRRRNDLQRSGNILVRGNRTIDAPISGPIGSHPQKTGRGQFGDSLFGQWRIGVAHFVTGKLFADETV